MADKRYSDSLGIKFCYILNYLVKLLVRAFRIVKLD